MGEEIILFIKGTIIGFSIAAPVGPIGLLCINRTLYNGRINGLVTGLGAATADMLYGLIAGFGLTFISNFLTEQKVFLQSIGSLFLLVLGIKILLTKSNKEASISYGKGLFTSYIATFFLTITNPVTILSFMAIFAGLGIGSSENQNYFFSFLLVAGVFLGSALWWLFLSGITSLFRERINAIFLGWVNKISGVIIIIFAIIIFLNMYI